jgi:hypothetical protein
MRLFSSLQAKYNILLREKDGVVEKEPYDSSTEKAKLLKIEDFGTLDEVKEMAKPIRSAHNRQEATRILKEITKKGLMTSRFGLVARLPGKSIGKMVSSEAVNASVSPELHFLAVANADKLFQNAIEPWKFELNVQKNNDGLKERHYLFAPMAHQTDLVIVKFTVKEYINTDLANKMYSIEAMDVRLG